MSTHRLGMAIACLRISTVAYVLLALALAILVLVEAGDPKARVEALYVLGAFAIFCLALGVAPESPSPESGAGATGAGCLV